MKEVRIVQIMRQYNIGLNTVVELLRNHDVKIDNISVNTKLPSSSLAWFDSKFSDSVEHHSVATSLIKDFKANAKKRVIAKNKLSNEKTSILHESDKHRMIINVKQSEEASRKVKHDGTLPPRREKKKTAKRAHNNKKILVRRGSVRPQNIENNTVVTTIQPPPRYTYRSISEINTDIILKWNDITFHDGQITFICNTQPFAIAISIAKESYNHIIKTFAKRLPPVCVKIRHSTASIENPIEFGMVINILEIHNRIFKIEEHGYKGIDFKTFRSIPKDLLHAVFPIDKTKYLEYLQEQQDDSIGILPVFESRNYRPDGFIFTIKRGAFCYVIWESCKHLAKKASYVFVLREDETVSFQQLLFDFVISPISKKRYYLRNNKVMDFIGVRYHYIDHNGFSNWKAAIDKILEEHTISIKSEEVVEYELKSGIRSYTPTHNIIQNQLKTILEHNGEYKNVVLESNNVDIKALTNSGEWHYYEVKTSSPRLCIREAIGQILEYSHYDCKDNVTELFIVGQYEPSDRELKYMSLLRELYSLPIWYKWYELTTHTLHSYVDE